MAAGSLKASAEPTGSGCAQPTAQLPPETPSPSPTRLPARSGRDLLLAEWDSLGMVWASVAPGRTYTACAVVPVAAPMRDIQVLPGQ